MLASVFGPKRAFQFTFRLRPRERSARFELFQALAGQVGTGAWPGLTLVVNRAVGTRDLA